MSRARDIYPDKYCNDPWISPGERRRRRLARARFIGTHTKLEWQAMRALFLHCPCCNRLGYWAAKDHIVSLLDGGSDSIENIQPLCMSCNGSKGGYSHDFRDEANPGWREKYPIVYGILEEIELEDRKAKWLSEAVAQQESTDGRTPDHATEN